jgi:zinc and cadmium transporter
MLLWILLAVVIVSLVSLVGIFFLVIKEKIMQRILILLIALASGSLIGGAFFHLIPESMSLGIKNVSLLFVLGLLIFFILEKFLHWRHCHEKNCEEHVFTYTVLFGDGLHNFIDGIVIAASFLVNISVGIATTLAIILHEIPQEIGDFAVLRYGGFSKKKALFYNFLIALTAVIGALVGYFLRSSINETIFLPIAAGGFLYIAATDLIPELHKKSQLGESLLQLLFILIGLGLILLL